MFVRRFRPLLLLAVPACLPEVPASDTDTDVADVAPFTLAELRTGDVPAGLLSVGPLVVVSGRAADAVSVVVQDAETGAGMLVLPSGRLDGWPPPLGTVVRLRGFYAGPSEAPVLYLTSAAAAVAVGTAEPRLLDARAADLPAYALVRYDEVEVRTDPDPGGVAVLDDGVLTSGRFGRFVPASGSVGSLTGVRWSDGSVAPRDVDDWSGTVESVTPVDTTVADVLDGVHPTGLTVQVYATQVLGWTRDGRYTVLQDEAGRGVWVDGEGWWPWAGGTGNFGYYTGQVVVGEDRTYLRSWFPPTVEAGTRSVVVSPDVVDGLAVRRVVSGLGPPDAFGERTTAEGVVLDNRFRDLSTLPDPVELGGVWDATTDPPRLAVGLVFTSPGG